MWKNIYCLLLFIFISILSFSDQLDEIFNSEYNVVTLVKEERFKHLKSGVYLNEEYIIYLDRRISPNKAILKNIRTNEDKIIFENSEIILSRFHYHVKETNRVFIAFKLGRLGKSPYTFWEIDLSNFRFKQIFEKDNRTLGEKLLEWNDGVSFHNEQSPQSNFIINDEKYIKLSAVMASGRADERDFMITREFPNGKRITVDRLPHGNEMHREFYPWPVLSSTERAFYAKLNYLDIREGRYFYHLELFASDFNNKIDYVKLTDTSYNHNFLIYKLLSSNQNKYVIVLGKNNDGKESYIALIRKKDLKVRYFPIEDVDYYRISLKYANYTVKENRVIIGNRQEDKGFIKLVFKKASSKKSDSTTKASKKTTSPPPSTDCGSGLPLL